MNEEESEPLDVELDRLVGDKGLEPSTPTMSTDLDELPNFFQS
jgi:hypothetical protein